MHTNTADTSLTKIRAKAAERPAAHPKSESKQTEKFLECIFTTSKHFSEGALIEYSATAGSRQFEKTVGGVQVRVPRLRRARGQATLSRTLEGRRGRSAPGLSLRPARTQALVELTSNASTN